MHGHNGAVHGHIIMRQAHGMPLSHLRVVLHDRKPLLSKPQAMLQAVQSGRTMIARMHA